MPPAFKQYSMKKPHEHSLTRFNKKIKEPITFKSKSLLNVADLNTQSNTNEIKKIVKKLNMFENASKGDKNMRDIIQGLQLKDKIPDFIKKDTGGVLQIPQKQEKSAIKIQKVIRGNLSRKEIENLKQPIELTKPVELFGGTKAGTIIHPEPTAPPQPLFGKNLKVTMKNNYDEIKKLFDIEPKSYQDVLDAKKKINTYKQNINRIKIRKNAKSILSDEEIALKKDILDEIKKMQKTYDKVYRDYYKTQQPKRGRPGKAKA
jgi:hypothetical protein